MNRLIDRMIRAARLDASLYEEVEHDESATTQALLVVVLAAVAGGLSALPYGGNIFRSVLSGVLGWGALSFVIMLVGTRLLPEPQTEADTGQLLRTLGFAQAPGVLSVLVVIPVLGGFIALGIAIWVICAMVVAVRQALDYTSTLRAVGVCVMGWIAMTLVSLMLGGFAYLP